MSTLQAIVLGIVQGLGEFLPISSSGHLIVTPWLLGWPPQSLAFDVALHIGTLAAVLYAFVPDWARIIASAFHGLRHGRPFSEPGGRLLLLLGVASIPGGVAGVLLEKWAETTFRAPLLVAFDMAVMGTVLFFADRQAPAATGAVVDLPTDISWRDALLIGSAQALALIPGVSRSGATISMALFLGHPREKAARFSFLLATPITAAAALYKVPKLLHAPDHSGVFVGMITAAIVGFLSIRVLLAYVRTRDYRPFVLYRYAFALMVAVVWYLRRSHLG